jgi:glycosyltransferase involved in cell wall biosynthesis
MNNLPLFSILIANYNNGKYLQECITSIFEQIYTNWEIVIVDDASTDESFEIYEKYKSDSRVKIYYNIKNKGCGYTKRKCVELAQGEICGFLDPDDTIEPETITILVNQHLNNPTHSIIYSTLYWCNENLEREKVWEVVGQIKEGESQLTSTDKKISAFATFKKSIYVLTSGINPKLKSAVDQDLYYKLEEQGPVLFIDKPLYNYRIHNKGISSMDINRIISYHSHLKVKKEAFIRRLNTNIPNISKTNLNKEWLNSYQSLAIAYQRNKSFLKFYYYLIISFKYIKHDKSFLTLKLIVSPLKSFF